MCLLRNQYIPAVYLTLLTYLFTYLLTYLPTYLLTPCSRVLLEKLTGFQKIKKFPAFYGTCKFITAFTIAPHLYLTWARSIQFMPQHPTFRRFILTLSSHLNLGFPSGLFPSGFPTKTLYTCPDQFIFLYLITRTILGEQYRSLSSS